MTKPLAGKVALVTGGSRGIGAAIARRLARDGAAVAITYASAQQKAEDVMRAIEADGRRAVALRADSADAGAVKHAVAQTIETVGRLDVLVNNAGVLTLAPVDQAGLDDFDRMVAVNIRAVFVAAQEASRHMREGGRIITIGSVNADRIPFAGGSIYAMTKAAVVGLTRGLARNLGPRGITVNNVQPGPVDTDMNPAARIALGRYGEGDEIASLVAYLVGAKAAFITGAQPHHRRWV